jgi:hypothetical protein
VFGKRLLKRTYGPNRGEVMGSWRKVHDMEIYNLYSLQNIIRLVKSRKRRCVEHVARIRIRNRYKILVCKPEGKI